MGFGMRVNIVDVVCDHSLKNISVNGSKSGCRFKIRLSYYRGLYLSCIEQFEAYIDGKKVPDQDVSFGVNNKTFSVYQLNDCTTEFWTLLEPAIIEISRPGGLNAGEHHIKVVLILRCPYLPLPGADGERMYMPIDGCGEKTLVLQDAYLEGVK